MLPFFFAAPLALANTPAVALPSALTPAVRNADDAVETSTAGEAPKRSYLMEVNFRGRYMTVPNGILDPFVSPHTDDEYPARPDINAYTLGLEFVVKEATANGIFYVEYLNPMIEEGYWDDADRGSEDPLDGSWVEPVNFAVITVGADYAYELHANNWLSFMFGAGLGAGFVLGDLYEWQAGEDPANPEGNNDNQDSSCGVLEPAYDRVEACPHDTELVADGDMPPVLPFIDINLGVRFSISNRAAIRLEGGLHNMFYGGAAVGVVF
ncbi:hypothetical protein LBMAG42_03260 [Deltaproteobacteria bacterium]|nr:hypothetical protein LBMAG42_03260 [Deltaproteobacteria bacterium]